MVRAIIFDFNGVIADDETPHIVCFRQALSDYRLTLKSLNERQSRRWQPGNVWSLKIRRQACSRREPPA